MMGEVFADSMRVDTERAFRLIWERITKVFQYAHRRTQ